MHIKDDNQCIDIQVYISWQMHISDPNWRRKHQHLLESGWQQHCCRRQEWYDQLHRHTYLHHHHDTKAYSRSQWDCLEQCQWHVFRYHGTRHYTRLRISIFTTCSFTSRTYSQLLLRWSWSYQSLSCCWISRCIGFLVGYEDIQLCTLFLRTFVSVNSSAYKQ